jgi:small GTP-binding protein
MVEALIDLRMRVEATLDFPEEEIDFLQKADAIGRLARVRGSLADVLVRASAGALMREGLHVVLAGRPNVGKSSLLNALAGAEVAIVTPIAGTTRDKVVQTIQIEGVPLHIVDTAGLRDATDDVERIGIERSWAEIGKADVVLHLVAAEPDRPSGASRHDALGEAIVARLPAGVPVVRVVNKIDLTGEAAGAEGTREVRLSARTGDGIAQLRATLLALAGWHATGDVADHRARAAPGGAADRGVSPGDRERTCSRRHPASGAVRRGTAAGSAGVERHHRRVLRRRPAWCDLQSVLYWEVALPSALKAPYRSDRRPRRTAAESAWRCRSAPPEAPGVLGCR